MADDVLPEEISREDKIAAEVTNSQLQQLTGSDPRCRGMALPEGILLRYTLTQSLFFYLRTLVKDGKITTRVFASDSPYDRQKTSIGEVVTPMFQTASEGVHLDKLKKVLHQWVDFVKAADEEEEGFRSFAVDVPRGER